MGKAGKTLPPGKKTLTPQEREQLLQETRELLKTWLGLRDFLLLAFQNESITEEQEKGFFELRTAANRGRRVIAEKLSENLDIGSDKINDFLHKAIDIRHLRGLPLADRRDLVRIWHIGSVMLHQAVGALEFIHETRQTLKGKKRTIRGVRDLKLEAGRAYQKSKLPMLLGVAVVIAVGAAVAYFLFLSA